MQNGFDAQLLPSKSIRIAPLAGGPTILDYLVSIEQLEDPNAMLLPAYGIQVDHSR